MNVIKPGVRKAIKYVAPPRYWFRPKKYGYGAVPTTWEGWTSIAVYIALVAAAAFLVFRVARATDLAGWLMWLVVVAALTVALIAVARAKTKGDWMRRDGSERE
jgi:hypothetical protein